MKTMTWPTRILLAAAAVTTAVAGYRYACYPNRDSALEAAYYLGVSARTGNVDARTKLDRLFPDDAKAQIAYEHGLQSPTGPALGGGEVVMDKPRVPRHVPPRHRSTPVRLARHSDAAQPAAAGAPVISAPAERDDLPHPVPPPGAATDSAESDRSLTSPMEST
ncbi:hypothetical protein [Paraburkholderia youngii]|uniref:hypothetical protein n=1 Tax=Paraburkholderia youngii TaxID=2782701 RepID=UPI003D1F179F